MVQLYTNNTEIRFLDKIKELLNQCDSFSFTVSFIKMAGLRLLQDEMKSALLRGASGRVITSTYQNFTDSASLMYFEELTKQFSKFECHLDNKSFQDKGFHTKGYIFQISDCVHVLIGSSNITKYALEKNIEWNLYTSETHNHKSISYILQEFEYLWDHTFPLNSKMIEEYKLELEFSIDKWDMDFIAYTDEEIKPNIMQKRALKEIRRYRDIGVNRALVIAATGSGKTYLSAFDAKDFGAKRLLFVVHRDTILKEAMQAYQNVFKDEVTYGLFMGDRKEIDADFIFSTNTSLSRYTTTFDKKQFDYIVIDEVHHAVASTYQAIMNYFEPDFWLGLTATPERMDNQSVFDLFDQNVPYELRLREALENDLIVPFKYYGIRDELVDYSDKNYRNLQSQLAEDLHCDFLKENIERYRPDGKLKAVVFCKNIEHAKILAQRMEDVGYNTTVLTGSNTTAERIITFKNLQNDASSLEMIFTVDLLNEGVDIPAMNMVIFLRPTESSTIFIQQLGRGLRKYPNKEYLTVLDFIGNSYSRSVQIALALGTLSRSTIIEKQLLISLLREDFKTLDLNIEINIDEKSKEEILRHIEKTNFNSKSFLIKDYQNFKKYLSTDYPPKHTDYLRNDIAPDLMRFIQSKTSGKKNNSYYAFLQSVEEVIPSFSSEELEIISYISQMLPIVRPYEFMIIKCLLESDWCHCSQLAERIQDKYENFEEGSFNHAIKYLNNSLFETPIKNKNLQIIKRDGNRIELAVNASNINFREHILDILVYGLERYNEEFGVYSGKFKIYANYRTEQIKLAMCEQGFMQLQGTIVKPEGSVYIFASLKKDERVKEEHLYEDGFKNENIFQWESTTNVSLTNNPGKKLVNSTCAHLFIRKKKEEDGIILPYTYFGEGKLTNPRKGNKSTPTLIFDILLDKAVPKDMWFDFMINDEKN